MNKMIAGIEGVYPPKTALLVPQTFRSKCSSKHVLFGGLRQAGIRVHNFELSILSFKLSTLTSGYSFRYELSILQILSSRFSKFKALFFCFKPSILLILSK